MRKLDTDSKHPLDVTETCDLLTVATERLSRMIEDVTDPNAIAIGHWTVRDVAAHVSHTIGIDRDATAGRPIPPSDSVADIDNYVNERVAADPEQDLRVLARRIRDRSRQLVEATARHGPGETFPWFASAQVGANTTVSHSLGDIVVHELDIARAVGRRWSIPRVDALAAIYGFLVPASSAIDFAEFAGGDIFDGPICIDLRIRGGHPIYFVVDEGSFRIEQASPSPADLHVSADPASLMMLMFQREPRWKAIVTGRVVAWGRHPLRALSFLDRMASALP